jgi:tetratricopeptide (TPR) repeat protein
MSETWIQDRTAINYLEKVIISLEWMWREQPNLDYGIDGQMEICDQKRPTGKLIAIQSKGGESYLFCKKDGSFTLQLKMNHLRYWHGYALPVIVVGYLPSKEAAFWIYIQGYLDENQDRLTLEQETVSIPVPRTNLFSIESKQILLSICDNYSERIARQLLGNRNLDMTIIEQLEQVAKKSGVDPINFESSFFSRVLKNGAPLEKGVAFLARGQNEEARNALYPLIKDTELYLANQYAWLAGAFLQEDHYEKAKSYAQKAITINPHDFYALNIRGACYAQEGDSKNAELDFQKTIEIAPIFSAPFVNRGKIFLDDRNYREGIKMFDQALAIFRNNIKALRMKGDCHKHLNEYHEAISSYEDALKLNKKDPDAWKGLGDIYFYQRKFDLSIDAFTKAFESDPSYLIALTNRGFSKYHNGDLAGARNDFNGALVIDPNNEHALKGLRRLDKSK